MGVNLDFSWMEDLPNYQSVADTTLASTGLDTSLVSTYNATDLGKTVNNATQESNDLIDNVSTTTDTNLTNFDYSSTLSNFDFSSLYSGGSFLDLSSLNNMDFSTILNGGVNDVVDADNNENDNNVEANNNDGVDNLTTENNNTENNSDEEENLTTQNNNGDVDKSTWSSVYGETATVTENTFMNFDDIDPNLENSGYTQATMNGEKVWVYEINTADYTGSSDFVGNTSFKVILTEDGKVINKAGGLFTEEDYTIEKWDASDKEKTGEWYDDYDNYTSFNETYFSIFGRDIDQKTFETLFGNETFSNFTTAQQSAHLFYTASGADKDRLLAMITNGDLTPSQLAAFGVNMQTLSDVWDWDFNLNQAMSKTIADKKKIDDEKKKLASKPKGFVMPKNVVHIGDEDAGKKGLRFTGMGTAGRNYASDPFAGSGLLSQPVLNTPSLIAKKTAAKS